MAATMIGLAGTVARAQTPDLFPLLPLWDTTGIVRTGFGYKDNVELSHANPQGSAFFAGGAELTVLHLDPFGPQFSLYATGDANEFFSRGLDGQYTAFSQAQIEKEFPSAIKAALAAQYFFQDQILDVSVTETNREAIPVLGHTISLRPSARMDLPRAFWLALETPATRQFFAEPLDDYWQAGAKLVVGQEFDRHSFVGASYEPSWWTYDHDSALTASGNAITNSHRERLQQDLRLTWRQFWDVEKHWRTTMSFGWRVARENGGGYYDYDRWSVTAQLLYRARPWEISAEGRWARYDYDTQTVSAADGALRRRNEWTLALRAERKLTRYLTVSASYEYEATRSNDELEEYSVNTLTGSLNWQF